MPPRSRSEKLHYVKNLVDSVKALDLNPVEEEAVVISPLKSLKLCSKIHKKPSLTNNIGCMTASFHTRKRIWEFRYENSQKKSDTLRTANLCKGNNPAIQYGLVIPQFTKVFKQREKEYYESRCRISHETIQDLHKKYKLSHESNRASSSTFFDLLSFYVRSITTWIVELCCCKLHLHGRRSITALLGSIKKHDLHLVEFNDYYSFSKYLTAGCPKDNYAHIYWHCFRDKTSLCPQRFYKCLFPILGIFL